ncbi:MAG: T9SS type A sorting domain-containing protein [Bacteroidales bacterium]|nr:T9SS type A sorting domain-containing protein [Bacteroidales bacterium]MCF8402799.1 T9SS type A sorting domain-containing protein [Bacteroidales bacterium]
MKKILLNILLTILPVVFFGQEYLSGISSNAVIQNYLLKHKTQNQYKSSFETVEPLLLPFYDDFTTITIYPDTSRWLDNEAFINSTFGYFPVNYGVATLDAIDANGNVYPEATPYTFLADRFTSKPIRLDAIFDDNGDSIRPITLADSVYFSFYYQPQGYGDIPLAHDSLVLEFGFYSDTIFSHFDRVWVYGYQYEEAMAQFGGEWLPPEFGILPYTSCDSIVTVLQDTFYIYDSLLIPCDSVFILDTDWTSVWRAEGDSLEVFLDEEDVFFKYVIIPIEDEAWLRKDFQFRFKNYASISNINSWQSNTDQWNLDKIYLNWGRSVKDKYSKEVSFIKDGESLITDHTSMPYSHYAGDVIFYKKDSISIFVNNLDSISHNYKYKYFVQNEGGDTLPSFQINNIFETLDPYYGQDVSDYPPFAYPPVKSYYTSLSNDTADFTVTHVIYDQNDPTVGDTLIYHQEFRNYFARDDGTAEAGYGLAPAGAKLAIKFKLEEVDSLRGVQMFFNKTLNDNNDRIFHICVWTDNSGKPNELLYKWENRRPIFTDSLNVFHTYIFPEALKLGKNSYYIGWEQTTNDNLNIGFDRNTNSKNKNFYNANGTWLNSSFEGSIMIRPMVGKPIPQASTNQKIVKKGLKIYPNPIKRGQTVTIKIDGLNSTSLHSQMYLSVFDIFGKQQISGVIEDKFGTDVLKPGIYIIQIRDEAMQLVYSGKLIITQ